MIKDSLRQHDLQVSPYALFILVTQQLVHFSNLFLYSQIAEQANYNQKRRGWGNSEKQREATLSIAAGGQGLQESSTASGFMALLSGAILLADDWDCITLHFERKEDTPRGDDDTPTRKFA